MRKRTVLSYLLLFFGFAVLIYFIISSNIIGNIGVLFEVNLYLLLCAFILSNLNVLVKIYRWKYLSSVYGVIIPFCDASRIVISSFFVSGATPAKIGDIIKAYIMKNKYVMPLRDGISCILYERVFELTLIFLVSLGILFINLSGMNFFIIQMSFIIIVFLLIAYIFSDKILFWAQKILIKTNLVDNKSGPISLKRLFPKQALYVFFLTGIALGFEFLRIWVVALAFGIEMNIIHLSIFFSMAVLIGLLSQIPIGIGVVEGSLIVFLTEAGISSYYAFGIVMVDRIISMYYVMIIGFIYYKWALTSAMEDFS